MADTPKVGLLLYLVDKLTAPVEGARKALGKLGASMKGLGNEAKSLLSNQLIQGIGFAGIIRALGSTWKEADELTRSMQRVQGTAKIVNVPLQTVRDTADAAAKTFGLSAASANNFASSAVTMAAKAGDAGKATELMAAVLDLAAARGISAEKALDALNITLKGQDEGLDALVQRNPSAYYDSWAKAAGRSAGSLTDVEKKLAIVDGLLADAAPVRGQFVDWLTTVDGKAFLAGQAMEDASAKFGIATESLRIQMLSAKAFGADLMGGVVEFFQKLGVQLALHGERASAGFAISIANIQIALGEFIAGNRIFLMVLGDTATEIGDRMQEAGHKRKRSAQRDLGDLSRIQAEMYAEIEGTGVLAERNLAAAAADSAQDRIDSGRGVVTAAKEDAAELRRIQEEAARIVAEIWDDTGEEIEAFIDGIVREAEVLVDVQDMLFQTINDGMETVTEGAGAAKDATKGIGDEAYNAARGAVALAEEFGGLDEQSAAVLNNVINLADSLKNGFKDMSAGNMIGAIGAVAGILGSIFSGNPAHTALVRKNNERLAELRDRIGDLLDLNAPGAKVAAVQGLDFTNLAQNTIAGNGRISTAKLTTYLAGKGLTLSDFRGMAQDAGFDLDERNGGMDAASVRDFIDGMKSSGTVGFESDTFAGQLDKNDFLNSILGVEGDGALASLSEILKDPKTGSPVLASIFDGINLYDGIDDDERKTMRERLGVIAQRFATGALSSADLNGLSNNDAKKVFGRISDFLDTPSAATGAAPAGAGTGTAAGTDSASVFASATTGPSGVADSTSPALTYLSEIAVNTLRTADNSDVLVEVARDIAAATAATAAGVGDGGIAKRVDEALRLSRDLTTVSTGA